MIQELIQKLVDGLTLSFDESVQAMNQIMEGEATPAQFGAFVTALRLKGETVDEVAGMASVMREKSLQVNTSGNLVDTCGTGGDSSGTFNVSTAAAFVAAGAGAKVAKHQLKWNLEPMEHAPKNNLDLKRKKLMVIY